MTWSESTANAECTCDSADNGIDGQRALIDADIYVFRERLRHAMRRLTVAEFVELRRRYEDVWLEVLAKLWSSNHRSGKARTFYLATEA
jgi:hypothetical protein